MAVQPEVQLGFDGMPKRLYACTPSRLLAWSDCPRRYRMTYLDRPSPAKGPPWAHNSFGASVHLALAGWWRLPPRERTPTAAGRLLEECWIDDGYRDEEQSAAWRRYARAMVEDYVAGLDPSDEPLGVERTLAVRTARLAFSGRVDRLDRRGDELAVVDYKTGRQPLGVDDARGSLALGLYALAARATLRRACTRVELHHVPSGTVAAHDHSEESLSRHLRRAEDIAEEAATADAAHRAGRSDDELFPPRPGPRCGWCDFAQHCPEGQAAATRQQSWAGLADLPVAVADDVA